MRIGLHTSIAGALERSAITAAELGANTFQIFSSSPRQWKASVPSAPAIKLLNARARKYDLTPLVIHDNYLINLASANEGIRAQSIEAFRGELVARDRDRRGVSGGASGKLQRTDGRAGDFPFSAKA